MTRPMSDPCSADAYVAGWHGEIVRTTPALPEVTVLTPVTLTDAERLSLLCDCRYLAETTDHAETCASTGMYDALINPDLLVERVERIVAARLLEQAQR